MGSNDALLNSGLPRALASFSICSAINGCLNRRTLLIYVISKPLSFALLLFFFFFFVHHALNCDLGQRLQVVHKMPQENEQSPCGGCLGAPLCRWRAGAGRPSERGLGDMGGDNSQGGGQRMRGFKLLGRAEWETNILRKFYRSVSRDITIH